MKLLKPFETFLIEDSEDVTTKQDIFDLINSLEEDFGTENVDYDEIMQSILQYLEDEYDLDKEIEEIEEARREFFDDDLGQMKKKRVSALDKKRMAAKAKLYYKKNKRKLAKKAKKYRKKIKSGKHIPKQHSRIVKK